MSALRDHQYTGAGPAPLPRVAKPTHAAYARTLASTHGLATLATARPDGHPFASVVQYVLDDHGQPITLMSELAEHTKNLHHDERASVMIASTVRPGDDPMALPRVTLLGAMAMTEEVPDGFADRFVAAHPTTASYVGFGDFHWWRLTVSAVRYVGGYGAMSWVPIEDYRATAADPLHAHAPGIVAHMNDDHADACLVYAQFYAGIDEATSARLLGVDQFGMDLLATTPDGLQPTRVNFDQPETTPDGVRKAVIALLARAREGGGT